MGFINLYHLYYFINYINHRNVHINGFIYVNINVQNANPYSNVYMAICIGILTCINIHLHIEKGFVLQNNYNYLYTLNSENYYMRYSNNYFMEYCESKLTIFNIYNEKLRNRISDCGNPFPINNLNGFQ